MGIPVPNYPNYLVEKDGRIYSIKKQRYLRPSVTKRGYCSLELFNNGHSKRFLVHRLVAFAYIPNPNNYPQINHKDENPSNNHVDNLEWCTAKYNMNYGEGAKNRHKKIDFSTPERKEIARTNGMKTCKKISQFDCSGHFIQEFSSIKEAYNNTKILHICEVCKGLRKTAGGYIWKYRKDDDLSEFQF